MCSCSLFSLPLFTLVAASMPHFLTGAITFSSFSSDKIGLLCFFFYLSVSQSRGPHSHILMTGGSDRGSYFIPKKIPTSEFVYPKKSLLFF